MSQGRREELELLYPWYKEEVFRRRERMMWLTACTSGVLVLVLVIVLVFPMPATSTTTAVLVCLGVALFSEYESLLHRPRRFAQSRLNTVEREELLDVFLSVCRWTRVYYAWRPNLRDESDNHVVELAVAGCATAIVTRNVRDYRIGPQLKFPHIEILTPARLLKGES